VQVLGKQKEEVMSFLLEAAQGSKKRAQGHTIMPYLLQRVSPQCRTFHTQ
jgi:hypothetical protein